MPVTDQISDFITRIRNAGIAGHKTVEVPFSKMKYSVSEILQQYGYISGTEKVEDDVQGKIIVTLKYYKRKPVIKELIRISKPGRRVYVSADHLPRVRNGLGTALISTSKGVLSDKQARKFNVGGEVLFTVW